MLDVLIQNASIVDGTGVPAYQGSVGIREGKLTLDVDNQPARETIDAAGRVLAPGFIDAHSHGDLILGEEFARLCKTSQGITTEIGGQCGLSIAPVNPQRLELLQGQLAVGALSFPKEMDEFTSFQAYCSYADRVPKTANMAMYIGHSTLRIAVMGFDNREPTRDELEQMKALLREAMDHGAMGLSTGLIYTPCCYAKTEEIVELAKVIRPYGGIYASHMRNESYAVVEAVRETIDIGRQAGVPVFISHHKVCGKDNWGLQKETLRLIHEARPEGIMVTSDQYPYACNMTHLNACVPPWHFDQGVQTMAERLKDPATRQKVRAEMEDPASPYDNYYRNAGGWEGVLVSSSPKCPEVEGKTIAQYAKETGRDPFEAFFDILVANQGASSAVYSSMCDEDVFAIAKDENTVVGTDGLTRKPGEKGHPRAYGSFPRAICYYVKENGIFTLEECIHRMTGLPAERLMLPGKGRIAEGYDADLVLFDLERLRDRATYTDPCALTEGLDLVMVAGEPVWKDGKLTGKTPGKLLRHNQR
ncbi:D-aminoacylase [Phocea massiliensis]|uniref:N-acyl-D-amino-acid deacylase family protein n=1 Tax=Merdimmobilis hominis TaxID=2897707 RepID=UPI001E4E5A93|nr:D-aminoacylase [Merdimmobilis hominis]MCD4836681.1 D-aminoacylase [Merdimmobilis hominis]